MLPESTPYDDVFRTLLTDCSSLVIPIINEVFGEHYTGEEAIEFGPNEHFLRQQDGAEQKRITDSSFRIIGKEYTKRYMLECQSTPDNSMLIRIFEYNTQIALEEGILEENHLVLEIPHSAVLFLRSTKNTPDAMYIDLDTPGGCVSFEVPVLKVKNYTIETIFKKELYFLIPFYIFTQESRFMEYENDSKCLELLKQQYSSILKLLTLALKNRRLTAYEYKTIIEMSGKVIDKITEKYENVKEGVKSIMGGQVLEYRTKTIYREGIRQGYHKGYHKGKLKDITLIMDALGYTADRAMDLLQVPFEERDDYLNQIAAKE